ncbi:hypothetical protein SpCBS45565_g04879 [Spizellomyces sp. 'palustris']|nr:hypothetical protein SpCBS45565_g04879 [Spizellomyces sp. 'palustris']
MVKLTSSDGQEVTVPKEIACQSILIKNMLEDVGEDDDQPVPLPNVSGPILQKGGWKWEQVVSKLKSTSVARDNGWRIPRARRASSDSVSLCCYNIFKRSNRDIALIVYRPIVIEYATHHKDDPPLPPEEEMKPKSSEDIDEWDREFTNVDQGTLFELILAANYLDMKGLLDLGCKTVANMIKGKSVEEIRKTFNIVNDFTPEEEEQIRKENEWCEDR